MLPLPCCMTVLLRGCLLCCYLLLQSLQKAQEEGTLPAEVVRVVQALVAGKQAHVVAQAALAGLVLVVAAAWLAALLLLPVCWIGLGGSSGCSVSVCVRLRRRGGLPLCAMQDCLRFGGAHSGACLPSVAA
jgi:Na+/H+ antiporter NhaB